MKINLDKLRCDINNDINDTIRKIQKRAGLGIISISKATKLLEELKGIVQGDITSAEISADIPDVNKKIECDHKFRDYDWYLKYKIGYVNGKHKFSYTIYEPYVCVKCGERKDIELESAEMDYFEGFNMKRTLDTIQKAYPKIRPLAEIEDEIGDDIRVDREYLKWHDFVTGKTSKPLNCGDDGKIELKL